MPVDITTEIDISRPVSEVAAYAADPTNAPEWYTNISSVEWVTEPPVRVGSRMRFVAHFLGRRLTYEVTERLPERRLVMQTAEGPFPMVTTYSWEPAGDDGRSTRMVLRNAGEPSGFAKIGSSMMARSMRRANTADLRTLKTLLETR